MIPKYIFNNNQKSLTGDVTVLDKLKSYRMFLYNELRFNIKFSQDKKFLIDKYKLCINEIDYEIKKQLRRQK